VKYRFAVEECEEIPGNWAVIDWLEGGASTGLSFRRAEEAERAAIDLEARQGISETG